jgi:hypothetical protein
VRGPSGNRLHGGGLWELELAHLASSGDLAAGGFPCWQIADRVVRRAASPLAARCARDVLAGHNLNITYYIFLPSPPECRMRRCVLLQSCYVLSSRGREGGGRLRPLWPKTECEPRDAISPYRGVSMSMELGRAMVIWHLASGVWRRQWRLRGLGQGAGVMCVPSCYCHAGSCIAQPQ